MVICSSNIWMQWLFFSLSLSLLLFLDMLTLINIFSAQFIFFSVDFFFACRQMYAIYHTHLLNMYIIVSSRSWCSNKTRKRKVRNSILLQVFDQCTACEWISNFKHFIRRFFVPCLDRFFSILVNFRGLVFWVYFLFGSVSQYSQFDRIIMS